MENELKMFQAHDKAIDEKAEVRGVFIGIMLSMIVLVVSLL